MVRWGGEEGVGGQGKEKLTVQASFSITHKFFLIKVISSMKYGICDANLIL